MKRSELFIGNCMIASVWVGLFIAGQTAGAQGTWSHYGCDTGFTSCNPAETRITPATIGLIERQWGVGCEDGWFSVYSRS
ncbi:hypothetical protein JXA80_07045, partial [bacterium]|nr:hypothetical protein [candidate division CSSED10-310 bacterium]